MAADLSPPSSQAPAPPAQAPGKIYKRRFQNLRTITALILREMSSTYGRSPGGYVWAVLEPLAMILVMSVAFSFLFRSPSLGTNFFLFYATGLMPFRMYQECQQVTAAALRYSRALLVYPVVSFADALFARLILAVMTQLMVSCLVLSGAVIFLDVQLVLDFGPILGAFLLAAVLGFGVGTLNCLLFDLYPIWKSTFTAITRPLMILSAVIYIYEDLPRVAQNILWFNPLVHVTGLSRSGYYTYYEPDYVAPIYVLLIALPAMFMGILFLRKYYRKILMI
jgi:capsular polysaccharide transport system permease protein